MNYNDLENDIKYLNATKTDMHFGVYVNTVGIQIIKAGEHYPLKDHPSGYFFNVGKGRVSARVPVVVYHKRGRVVYIRPYTEAVSYQRSSAVSFSRTVAYLFPFGENRVERILHRLQRACGRVVVSSGRHYAR